MNSRRPVSARKFWGFYFETFDLSSWSCKYLE